MGFNPFEEKGTPIDKQIKNWSTLNPQPYDKHEVHPYTRVRGIFMNGIETESAMFLHQFNRHTDDVELKQMLAMIRRTEQQQQKMINWMLPADESVLEITIGYEQVAVDLTAFLAKTEPDKYVKSVLDFALIEDFDHLYRYANLLNMTNGRDPAEIVGDYTEIMPGRPTKEEHRHPFDTLRKHYDDKTADPLTKLHVLTIVAAEQQTMNFYMNVGNRPETMLGRALYLEIGMMEEQHVTQYECLADPRVDWLDMMLLHDYNECWCYWSMMQQEVDPRVKQMWEQHLMEEVEHVRMDREITKKMKKMDPAEKYPKQLPDPLIFQSNKEYVREIVAAQVDLTAKDMEFVNKKENPRYAEYQKMVNSGEYVPSEKVIDDHIKEMGEDYRLQTEGEHPVNRLRQREMMAER